MSLIELARQAPSAAGNLDARWAVGY